MLPLTSIGFKNQFKWLFYLKSCLFASLKYMKKNSNAFTLIKSLAMSEKRYFKIFSERHKIGGQNKYVALFDVLEEAEVEKDAEIKKQLSEKQINTDFLSADKNYLYNLILRSLNEYYYSKTYNLDIKESLISIEILFHKGLYRECLVLISKTEILAEECENFQLMIDLLMWKKKCSGYSLGLQKALEVNQSIDKYILLLNNLKRTTDLYYESNLIQANKESYSQAEIINQFKGIINQPELESEKNALSFTAKVFYHLIYSNFYKCIADRENELKHLQKLVDILNSSTTYSVENPLDYISIYNRLLSIKTRLKSASIFEDINNLKEFSKKVQIRREIVMQRIFVHTNTHELEYYLIKNDYDSASRKTKEIESEVVNLQFDIEPYHLINLYYLQAISLIYLGKYHQALKFINKVLLSFSINDRPQVYLRVEVLNCIVHYELKNYLLSASLAKRILKKNIEYKILISTEEMLLKSIIQLCGVIKHTLLVERNQFEVVLKELNHLKANSKLSANSTLLDNYQKWLQAKVKNKLVSDLY